MSTATYNIHTVHPSIHVYLHQEANHNASKTEKPDRKVNE